MSDVSNANLLGSAEHLQRIATRLGLPELGREIVEDTDRRLGEATIRALVIGEIKQGKTSLINALLGEELLPVGVTPTTGAVVVVRAGQDEPGPYLEHPDGGRQRLDADRFKRLAKGPKGNGNASPDDHGELELIVAPGILPSALELVDTPGINDVAAFRAAISRGALPRADILVLVLDATQLLNRTEMAFLRDAISAVGGLTDSGARLLLAINRIDLIAERERPKLLAHLQTELATLWNEHGKEAGGYDVFVTDARTAVRDAGAETPGVAGVRDLRDKLFALAETRSDVLPLRARASLLRYGSLLGHNASVAARALNQQLDALRRDVAITERELAEHQTDLTRLRKTMAAERETILRQSAERTRTFSRDLQASVTACIDGASQRILASHVAGSIHDAYVVFAHRESELLRTSLDELTRKAIHTHSEQARRRLFHATMRLSFRGPTAYISPPSVMLEAGMVAVGVAGTAIMYFGNMVAGMVMAVAGPLATVVLREKSLRDARARAKQELPAAMDRASEALREQIRQVVEDQLAALDEHLVLANVALGEQLLGVLRQAIADLEAAAHDPEGQQAKLRELHELELELASVRRDLERMHVGAPDTSAHS